MRKFISALILVPFAIVLTVFAVANRQFVTLSFDPFSSSDPALSIRMPLFVLMIVVAVLGVVAGGLATWFRQRHWRKDARRSAAELAKLRAGQGAGRQAHDPEKWAPAFGKDHAQTQKSLPPA